MTALDSPAGWKLLPLKRIAKLNPSKSELWPQPPPDELVTFLPMERVSEDGRIAPREFRAFQELLSGYTYFRRGDVLVAKITPCFENGKGASLVGLPTDVGFGSTEFTVLRPTSKVLSDFLYRVTMLPAFRFEGEQHMTGAAGQQRVRDQFIQQFQVLLPPLDEQAAIVKYLAHVDRKIDRFIRSKRRMIELLNEQKQAIIHQAVTKGLDPTAPMKDSGVEWLGEIPAHWEAKRGKYYLQEIDERSTTGTEELMSVSHITGVTPRSEKQVTMFKAESYVGHKLAKPQDVVANTMWMWMAAVGVSPSEGLVSPSYATYRARDENLFDSVYLDLLLRNSAYKANYQSRSTGIRGSRLRLYPEQFLDLRFVRPPLVEQLTIVRWLATETEVLDRALLRTQQEIELIREFRVRLINDVVTGKIDVREVAATLPEMEDAELSAGWTDELEPNGHDDESSKFENDE